MQHLALFRQLALLFASGILVSCANGPTADSSGSASFSRLQSDRPDQGSSPAGKTSEDNSGKPAVENVRIFKGTGALVKAPRQDAAQSTGSVSLNFEAADIRDIAKTVLAEILQESYIIDPKVAGTISFRSVRPLPREALLPTLETVLRMNGIIMVKENGIFKIIPAASVKGSLSPKLGSGLAGYSAQVVPLRFIGAKEMAKILEGFATDAASVKVDELRNLLILTGTQNEVQHMMDTIDMFDVDWLSGMSIGLFTLQTADVKTVDAELGKILGDKNANPLAGAVRFIPIERLNAFVIITPQPYYLEQAKLWLERLDRAGGNGGTRLFVYRVQNGKAEHLAELLNQTFGGKGQGTRQATPAGVAPGLASSQLSSSTSATGASATTSAARPAAAAPVAGSTLSISDESGTSEVRVVADKETNSLLILANQAGFDKIVAAIKRLDESPRQVLIEVMIAEVSLTDDFSLGVEWTFTHGDRRSGKLDVGDAGIGALTPGFSLTQVNLAGTSVQAALNMLAANGKVNVLSSPHIMVADNQTAKIQVGRSIPISQSTLNGTTTVNSTSYLDTGVILSVTPRINAGGLVNLEIDQEFSVPSTSTTSTAPTISKRTAKTKMTAQSGETMVMGGLISEESNNTSSGLPVLSSIPVVGGLFGTTKRQVSKTELIVLITPRVASNVGQAKALSDELRRKMSEAQDLADCGTANLIGYTSRGGLWCIQPGRLDGKIDRMKEFNADGQPIYTQQRPSIPPEDFNQPHPSVQKATLEAAPSATPSAPSLQTPQTVAAPPPAPATAAPAPAPSPVPAPVPAKPAPTPTPAPAAEKPPLPTAQPVAAPAAAPTPPPAPQTTAPAPAAPPKVIEVNITGSTAAAASPSPSPASGINNPAAVEARRVRDSLHAMPVIPKPARKPAPTTPAAPTPAAP